MTRTSRYHLGLAEWNERNSKLDLHLEDVSFAKVAHNPSYTGSLDRRRFPGSKSCEYCLDTGEYYHLEYSKQGRGNGGPVKKADLGPLMCVIERRLVNL